MTRYISWNVNGLRAAEKKGFSDSMLLLKEDITPTPEEIEAYAEEFAAQKHRFARHPEPAGKAEVLQIYTNSLLKRRH